MQWRGYPGVWGSSRESKTKVVSLLRPQGCGVHCWEGDKGCSYSSINGLCYRNSVSKKRLQERPTMTCIVECAQACS